MWKGCFTLPTFMYRKKNRYHQGAHEGEMIMLTCQVFDLIWFDCFILFYVTKADCLCGCFYHIVAGLKHKLF